MSSASNQTNGSGPPGTECAGLSAAEARFGRYPGAHAPARQRRLESHGPSLQVCEWGEPEAPPLLLAHGGFDFARTFDVFAPLLAGAGYRVVSWDQRGHGDSEHAALHSWESDLRDALAVLNSVSHAPLPFVGHSKGGSLLTQLAQVVPHRVSHLANLDGLPSKRAQPDVADHERGRLLASELEAWLDHRRSSSGKLRKPGDLEALARRRGRMNPRLSHEWLCYLVSVGARKDSDGWRWKIDPTMRFGGFGPWRPDWALRRLPGLAVPLLGVLAGQREPMGFETHPDDLAPYLPPGARIEVFEQLGHFLHIEAPETLAELVLEFLRP
jgi:pimeloyl-ACP methyl ester carboxylesterase